MRSLLSATALIGMLAIGFMPTQASAQQTQQRAAAEAAARQQAIAQQQAQQRAAAEAAARQRAYLAQQAQQRAAAQAAARQRAHEQQQQTIAQQQMRARAAAEAAARQRAHQQQQAQQRAAEAAARRQAAAQRAPQQVQPKATPSLPTSSSAVPSVVSGASPKLNAPANPTPAIANRQAVQPVTRVAPPSPTQTLPGGKQNSPGSRPGAAPPATVAMPRVPAPSSPASGPAQQSSQKVAPTPTAAVNPALATASRQPVQPAVPVTLPSATHTVAGSTPRSAVSAPSAGTSVGTATAPSTGMAVAAAPTPVRTPVTPVATNSVGSGTNTNPATLNPVPANTGLTTNTTANAAAPSKVTGMTPVTLGNGDQVYMNSAGSWFDRNGNSITNATIAAAQPRTPSIYRAAQTGSYPNTPPAAPQEANPQKPTLPTTTAVLAPQTQPASPNALATAPLAVQLPANAPPSLRYSNGYIYNLPVAGGTYSGPIHDAPAQSLAAAGVTVTSVHPTNAGVASTIGTASASLPAATVQPLASRQISNPASTSATQPVASPASTSGGVYAGATPLQMAALATAGISISQWNSANHAQQQGWLNSAVVQNTLQTIQPTNVGVPASTPASTAPKVFSASIPRSPSQAGTSAAPSQGSSLPKSTDGTAPAITATASTSTTVMPAGLTANDKRWADTLPADLKQQVYGLSAAQVDNMKQSGHWRLFQSAITDQILSRGKVTAAQTEINAITHPFNRTQSGTTQSPSTGPVGRQGNSAPTTQISPKSFFGGDKIPPVSAVFLAQGETKSKPGDPNYVNEYRKGATHAGTDFAASVDTKILSPVSGKIVYYSTQGGPSQTLVVIRDDQTGRDYVLGHISCPYCLEHNMPPNRNVSENSAITVKAGEHIGNPLPQDAVHVHVGLNTGTIVDQNGELKPPFQHGKWGDIGQKNEPGSTQQQQEREIKDNGWIPLP